jgi:hypothetical protein
VSSQWKNPNGGVNARGGSARLGPFGGSLQDPAASLGTLWDDRQRPAISLVLGHMETKDLAGEPEGPRVVLQTRGGQPITWLQDRDVMDRVEQGVASMARISFASGNDAAFL